MTVIIKGIETRDEKGNPYVRRDIDDWYTDQVNSGGRKQLTLFLEALDLIQKRPLDHLLSYFRLAAIHSAPWCKWDDVDQPPDQPGRIKGYCVHNDYTFPTWHRVYMLLYERALYDAMNEWIRKTVPANLQGTWKQEADKWRLPYWDFARLARRPPLTPGAFENDIYHDKLRLPILCMMPSVGIVVFRQNGDQAIETRPNPLYKYVTPKLMGEFPAPYTITGEYIPEETIEDPKNPKQKKVVNPPFTYPWDKCYATTKYGLLDGFDASIWADGGQNWLRANYALNEHPYYGPIDSGPNAEDPVPTLQDLVYRLFQYGLDSWGAFSSSRYTSPHPEPPESSEIGTYDAEMEEGNAKNAMNLEFIHNNIHNFVGGTQFLRPPKESIHLWGAGHMSSVLMSAFDPIFFIFHNNIDRLTAIWQSLNWGKWFDDEYSKQTRDNLLTPFHKDEHRNFWKSDDVREWTPLGYDYEILHGRVYKDGEDEKQIEEDRKKILKDIEGLYGKETKHLFDGLPEIDGKQDDYVITVIYDRYALGGAPYKINLYLTDTDQNRGPDSEGFIASVYNFSGSLESTKCENCQQQKDKGVKSIAQVPATVPMRRHLRRTHKAPKEAPQPVYLALNTLGNPVKMDVHVGLHRSRRPYYANPIRPVPGDPLEYGFIKHGKQAEEVFSSIASTESQARSVSTRS